MHSSDGRDSRRGGCGPPMQRGPTSDGRHRISSRRAKASFCRHRANRAHVVSLACDHRNAITANLWRHTMKLLTRSALLGAAGLALLALPAYAQRPYDPSAGSVGYKQQTAQRPYDPSAGSVGFRNENPGGVGYKAKAKGKKKSKKAKK